MNYQNFVDTVEMPCCVMSVEKTPAGTCGEIRIIHANQEDIFRKGGDEFVIITSGIDQETFYRKVKRLRNDVEKNSRVSFAVGEFWSEGSQDIKDVFRYADERMYADKNAFYENHPDLRRK